MQILSAELVEKVVLLGAPISIKDQNWEAARKVTRCYYAKKHFPQLAFFFSSVQILH